MSLAASPPARPSPLTPPRRRALVGAAALAASLLVAVAPSDAATRTTSAVPTAGTSVVPAPDGSPWLDVDGESIAAHGGSVVPAHEAEVNHDITGDGRLADRVWLWYGENKTNATRPVDGVRG